MFMNNTADLDLATGKHLEGRSTCSLLVLYLGWPYGPSRVKTPEILRPAYEYLDGAEPNVQIIVREFIN